ncbi:unnamed protein product [Brassicogethes aeneus]|uniref:Uncharacterized protein n=1 Tax=Brassicogethes aeneus TaxID=1431903 RepID=A0A9P0BH30_BRAAE|nr:unnamed protein product [Brassicogethes aeneus]
MISQLAKELEKHIEQNTKREIKTLSTELTRQVETINRVTIQRWLETHRLEDIPKLTFDVDTQTTVTQLIQTEEEDEDHDIVYVRKPTNEYIEQKQGLASPKLDQVTELVASLSSFIKDNKNVHVKVKELTQEIDSVMSSVREEHTNNSIKLIEKERLYKQTIRELKTRTKCTKCEKEKFLLETKIEDYREYAEIAKREWDLKSYKVTTIEKDDPLKS